VVSETPGTTRDVVTTRLALGGWPIELADTAGLRGDASPLERAGMALALGEAASADLCLWVVERTALPPPEIPPSRCVLVRNKIDLPAPPDEMNVGDIVRVSARTGEGLDVLIARIVSELIPNVPAPGEAVPVLEAHRIRLAQAVAEVSSPTARG
jgi:tRNA modification GTPase